MGFEKLGPYRVERILGRGGMGTVYQGLDDSTGQRRAIKVLSSTLADDADFRQRFAAEIETLKALNHPNIVRLTGYGEQDGHLFYAMELVDGRSLQDEILAGRTFDWQEVIRIGIQICAALKHAHDHGVIHRDLKPANLLWNEKHHVKLTDFGIAKLFGSSTQTAPGGVIGTADFMAPEQAEGRPATVRTDLYSTGAVLYALLAQRPPFAANTVAEVLHRLRYEEPVPLGRLSAGVPQELELIISQLLEKDPDQRIATARALANRLKAMEHGLAVGSREVEFDVDLEDDAESGVADRPGRLTDPANSIRPTVEIPEDQDEAARHWRETALAADSESRDLVADDLAGHPAATTHYTNVDQDLHRPSLGEETSTQPAAGWGQHLTTLLLAGILVAILVIAWLIIQPATADQLYQRIYQVASRDDPALLIDVRKSMQEFVDRFPDDSRAAQVADWQRDDDCYRLWRRLEREARKLGGPEFLQPFAHRYVVAWRLVANNASAAAAEFSSLIQEFRHDTQADQYCRGAEHMLKRLSREEE